MSKLLLNHYEVCSQVAPKGSRDLEGVPMKTIRQLASFLLGITLGVCLLSLVRLRLLFPGRPVNSPAQVVENLPNHAVTPPPAHRSVRVRRKVRTRVHTSRHVRAMSSEVAEVRLPARPRRRVKAHGFASERTTILARARHVSPTPRAASVPSLAQVTPIPQALPSPTLFKAIGYVEKADGQLEAIIMQEDQIDVVHLGDRIADRYRVTSITHDVVGAIDETAPQVTMAKPGGGVKSDVSEVLIADATDHASMLRSATIAARPEVSGASVPSPVRVASSTAGDDSITSTNGVELASNCIGYVKKYDGKIEVVVADEDSVRLVPATHSETITQAIPPGDHREATPAAEVPTAQSFRAPVTVASSAVGDSSVHSGVPGSGAAFRQVVYRDSTPAADGAAPSQVMLSTEREPSELGSAIVNLKAPTLEKSGSSQTHRQYPFDIKAVWFMMKYDLKK
jgi:hypothetical protein